MIQQHSACKRLARTYSSSRRSITKLPARVSCGCLQSGRLTGHNAIRRSDKAYEKLAGCVRSGREIDVRILTGWVGSGQEVSRSNWSSHTTQTRPDPIRPDPARPDPIRSDPTRPDPTRPDPSRHNRSRPDPTRPDQTESDQT